jgi:condensin complex subunit 2
MPRVRASGNPQAAPFASPVKTVSIPLNDDRSEKAARLQSRHIAHSKQLDQLKAAATPNKKRRSLGAVGEGPETPSQDDGFGVRGDAVTPMKRVPILANFEEWMKMATDNKINANNSWNFALIDYFHDMSLLKEGDQINFQKASCTLDGCVKIYTSRVDSVATETGKLLSGLADSGNKKRKGDDADADGEEGDDDEEGEDGQKKKTKKKTQRSAEATLVNSFEQLRLKKMELEFSVDPLFKKASADFDEGGAKGLLLNHLSIDGTGRIVFDSSDDAREVEETRQDSMEPEGEEDEGKDETTSGGPADADGAVNIAALGARFFPNLDILDEQDICPSLKSFELGGGDGAMDLPFLKAPENWRDEHPETSEDHDEDEAEGFDGPAPFDNDDGMAINFDDDAEVGFGEGGEAWAKDAAIQPQMRVHNASADGEEGGEVGTFDTDANAYGVTLQHREQNDHENILNYFDTALHKNWAGPEHWKISRIKEANKPAAPQRVRKEKEAFEIDFTSPMTGELASMLYTKAASNAAISLPKREWRSKTRNLLPDDKHFNSKDLLKLFLKPKAKLGARGKGQKPLPAHEEVGEAYWAANGGSPPVAEEDVKGDYDANFFADDNLPMPGGDMDDDSFADAREVFSPDLDDAGMAAGPIGPGIDAVAGSTDPAQEGAFGAQLVTQSRRLRPEYVQYARVAKKVDVRRLKEEMWRGIGFEERYVSISHTDKPPPFEENKPTNPSLPHRSETPQHQQQRPQIPILAKDETGTLMFTDIMNNLSNVYPKTQLADISTSYGFICLLHLANEKGLVIENVDGWENLTVKRDFEAQVSEGDI